MRLLPVVLAAALVGSLALSTSASAAPGTDLFVQQVSGGSLEKSGKRYRLVLEAPQQTIEFSDRPARRGSSITTTGLVSRWEKYGFRSDPPNAALSINVTSNRADVFLLTLRRPRISRGRLIYAASPLKGAPSAGLRRFRKRADRVRVLGFGEASLFIDPSGGYTPLVFQFTNVQANGNVTVTLDQDSGLEFSSGTTVGQGLLVTGPFGGPIQLDQFVLQPRMLMFMLEPNMDGSPSSVTVQLYVYGGGDLLEASANLPGGSSLGISQPGYSGYWTAAGGSFTIPIRGS